MKRKIAALLLAAAVVLVSAAGCAAGQEIGGYTPETYGESELVRGGFWAPDRTAEAYAQYKAAGFNTLLFVRHDLSSTAAAKANNYYLGSSATAEALELCRAVGLKAYLNYGRWEATTAGDSVSPALLEQTAAGIYAPYIADGTVIGMHMGDEPYKSDIDEWLGEDALAEAFAEGYAGGRFFANLHPWIFFNNNNGFGMGLNATYADYVNYYADNVLAELPEESRLLSVDVYPYTKDGLEPLWLATYETVANAALGCGAGTGFYMQAQLSEEGTYSKELTYADMRMQAYTALAYGAEQLLFYCYTCPDGHGYEYCMLDPGGAPSPYYSLVQQINAELAAFENVYTAYEYTGTFPVLSGQNDDVNLQLLGNRPDYTDMLYLTSVTADKGILVGTFAREGGEAYMLVNFGDTAAGQAAEVCLTLRGSNFAALYGKNGAGANEAVVRGENGTFTFTLEAGEGLFVVPLGA